MVDVQLERRLERVLALEELRKHATKELKNMVLLRKGNRLSITPVAAAEWKFVLSLE
jgi:predicted RNA-binding protein with PUA-like domain